MLVIPKEQPVIENINSYYIDIIKLFEHYQGEIGSGVICLVSSMAEGAIFFDKDELLNGIIQDKIEVVKGQEAIKRIMEKAVEYSFNVSVYKILSDNVYFWSSIPDAKKIYKDLSTDFTDLEGLISKMNSEKLTGHIDISIKNGEEEALIFFNNGEIVGGSTSWSAGDAGFTKETREMLIQKTKEKGGVFNVSEFQLTNGVENNQPVKSVPKKTSTVKSALEELLRTLEEINFSMKIRKIEFKNQLKKKFIEKADTYSFLDPFAAEFEYANGRITFTGSASDKELAKGVIESIRELAEELGILQILTEKLSDWSQRNAKILSEIGVDF
ncbi:MAG: hypothetical protein MUP22_14180 [Desulfobacterales bacterium]|nr:hypothetical protein [Desulfobacterales bacterium]